MLSISINLLIPLSLGNVWHIRLVLISSDLRNSLEVVYYILSANCRRVIDGDLANAHPRLLHNIIDPDNIIFKKKAKWKESNMLSNKFFKFEKKKKNEKKAKLPKLWAKNEREEETKHSIEGWKEKQKESKTIQILQL